jgi:uncharacterized repeat protein (TIGR01451 family)
VTASGNALGLTPADTDTASATVTAFTCDIEVTKSAPGTACVGDTVTYTYHVINAGTVALTGVTVSDNTIPGAQAAFQTANGGSTTLAVGADITFTLSAVHNTPGSKTNTVTASGNALGLTPADTDTASATVIVDDCAGNLFHTGTTCRQFLGLDPPSGLAGQEIEVVQYGVKQGKINNTAPGVFFYYNQVTAPSSSFTIDVEQSETHPTFSTLFGVQQQNQITLFDADCSTVSAPVTFTISNGGGQAHINISGATVGQVFIFSVKYDTSTVVGQNTPNPTTVHYDFVTHVSGAADSGADSLDLKKKGT